MIWASKVTLQCEQCPKTATYDNPGKHSLTIVTFKAFKDGWWVPRDGKCLCPDCVRKLITQTGMKPHEQWVTQEARQKIEAVEQLPLPPKLLGEER